MEPSSACSYVATQRGGVALLFEGHRYNKVRDGKDGTVYWRCSRDRQCPGRAVTVNNRVKKSNNKHNHPPEASLMLRNEGINSNSTTSQRYSSQSAGSRTDSPTQMMAAAAAYASFLQNASETNIRQTTPTALSSRPNSSITPNSIISNTSEITTCFIIVAI
ncbi:FLYWCH zinc finger domain containing protein [Sarcoptes scabiei]|uniref:FLYWCH zinc finger domain containing protein n=1 Tax=Sarcoptes scabiei TaxID=52283 RepID=A0A131ZZ55_SARSC|nr:FLYWCH zinc finger domain containing protein [Sarcoptes scabiei]